MNWCILIPALVGLLCGILGYLLGRLLGGGSSNIDEWKRKNAKLEADLDACRSKLSAKGPSAASTSSSVASSFAATATGVAFNADAAKAVFGKRIKENDLTVVEGIGPKIQELFHNHDVKTWAALAGCSVDKCQKVLLSGGDRFKMHNPGTWPKQAGMAAEGKWQELLDWQDALDGGK